MGAEGVDVLNVRAAAARRGCHGVPWIRRERERRSCASGGGMSLRRVATEWYVRVARHDSGEHCADGY